MTINPDSTLPQRLTREEESLEMRRVLRKAALGRAGLPEHTRSLKRYLRDFGKDEHNTAAHAVLARWLGAVTPERRVPKSGFCLQGGYGRGKTELLKTFGCECLIRSLKVYYLSLPPLQREVGARLQEGGVQEACETYRDYPVLILDQFGQEDLYPWWINGFVANVIEYRDMHELPTILGTVYTYAELEARLLLKDGSTDAARSAVSRIRSCPWVPVTGPDRRGGKEIDW